MNHIVVHKEKHVWLQRQTGDESEITSAFGGGRGRWAGNAGKESTGCGFWQELRDALLNGSVDVAYPQSAGVPSLDNLLCGRPILDSRVVQN